MEMTLEERALRDAYAFFKKKSQWWQRGKHRPLDTGSTCIALRMDSYRRRVTGNSTGDFNWVDRALGVDDATEWNDSLKTFKEFKAHLAARIEFYERKRCDQ